VADIGQEVRLPLEVAADLVAGHVDILWNQVFNEVGMEGCCNRCCAPCSALSQLLDLGLLDELYRFYHRSYGGQSLVWDEEKNQIDREWLDRAWPGNLGCHSD
jgi:hypothetical protein